MSWWLPRQSHLERIYLIAVRQAMKQVSGVYDARRIQRNAGWDSQTKAPDVPPGSDGTSREHGPWWIFRDKRGDPPLPHIPPSLSLKEHANENSIVCRFRWWPPETKNHFRLTPGMRGYLMISSRPLLAYPIRLSLQAPRSAWSLPPAARTVWEWASMTPSDIAIPSVVCTLG